MCAFGFGGVSIGTAFVKTRDQLLAVRFLLGMFESCTIPGMTYYLSRWYRRKETVFRISLFIVAAPIAGVVSSVLAYGILKLPNFGSLHGWRMIFAIEGTISAVLGVVGALLLTDRPEKARWLTPEERHLVEGRVLSERPGTDEHLDTVTWAKFWRGCQNPVVLCTAILFFLGSFTAQGLAYFLPSIVATIYPDKSKMQQQLFTAPPHALGVFLTIAISYLSSWLDKRLIILIFCALPVVIAYLMFLSTSEASLRYAAAFLVAGFCHMPAVLTCAQVTANVESDASRSSAVSTNTVFASLAVS